jgi:hypothetical protein
MKMGEKYKSSSDSWRIADECESGRKEDEKSF